MRHEASRERNARVVSEYAAGEPVASIAAKFGITKSYVRALASKAGVKRSASEGRVKRLRYYAECGFNAREAAELEGVKRPTIYNLCSRNGIVLAEAKRGRPAGAVGVQDVERAEAMVAMFTSGKTLQQIGDLFSVSRERVRQILKKHGGIVGRDGGHAKMAAEARAARKAEKERLCQEKHGCSLKQLAELRRLGRVHRQNGGSAYTTPIQAFVQQRSNARARGIEWNIKLWEWWTIWQQSGKWDQRGRGGDAFVMCRFKDEGAYEVGNVYIASQMHNLKVQPNNPYRNGHPDHDKVWAQVSKRRGPSKHKGCAVEGCVNRHYARGYCNTHYRKFIYLPARAERQAEAA